MSRGTGSSSRRGGRGGHQSRGGGNSRSQDNDWDDEYNTSWGDDCNGYDDTNAATDKQATETPTQQMASDMHDVSLTTAELRRYRLMRTSEIFAKFQSFKYFINIFVSIE